MLGDNAGSIAYAIKWPIFLALFILPPLPCLCLLLDRFGLALFLGCSPSVSGVEGRESTGASPGLPSSESPSSMSDIFAKICMENALLQNGGEWTLG